MYGQHLTGEDEWIWSETLRRWCSAIESYCAVTTDLPFRHNVHANISLLSSAIWMAGGTAVCEFAARDSADGEVGRLGLVARHKGTPVFADARLIWCDLRNANSLGVEINGAHAQIRPTIGSRKADLLPADTKRYSIVFVVPIILPQVTPVTHDMAAYRQIIGDARDRLLQVPHDWCAWGFPPIGRTLPRKWAVREARFLGVMVHGQEV
jgi:hypothetical protein